MLRFVPSGDLEPDHRYYLYVGYSPYFRDLAGNLIAQNNSHYFNTGGFTDDTAPAVVEASIADGSVGVAVNARLIVRLDERVGDACQPTALFSSAGGDVVVPISVGSDRQTLTLKPASALSTSTSYSLSLSNLCDYAGNAFSAADVVSFTTSASATADTLALSVISITPSNGASGVAVDTSVVIEFSEAIEQTSRPLLTGGGVTVLGDYEVSGNTLTFTPSAPLQGDIQYRMQVTSLVWDLSGNTGGSYYYFTTN